MAAAVTIAFDTNFLLYCIKQKIDFLQELDRLCSFAYKLVVPQQVMAELERIAETKSAKSKDKKIAEIALQLLDKLISEKQIRIKRIKASGADDALLKLDKKTYVVATLDRGLRQKLKNAKLLGIKQFKYLYFA